jgi:hypothetical protein
LPCSMLCGETLREEVLPLQMNDDGSTEPYMSRNESEMAESLDLPYMNPPLYSRTLTAGMACVGVLCLLPTAYGLRYNVDKKCHPHRRESVWKTALITCFAWPCSLTQMSHEMQRYYF